MRAATTGSRLSGPRRPLALLGALALTLSLSAAPVSASPGSDLESPGTASAAALATSSCSLPDFTDVPPGSPYYTPVTWMACQALTLGYTDGSYGVYRPISRGEVAAMLYRMVDPVYTAPATSPFPDVSSSHSFYPAIAWLHSEGIVRGYTDSTFRKDRSISRGEIAQVLFGTADPAYTASGASGFSDVGTGHPFYEAVSWMHDTGFSQGYADGTYRPTRQIHRGETAALIHRSSATVLGAWAGRRDPEPSRFTLSGSGWGHGVGMSQYGAAALARRGQSVAWILGHYYHPATSSYTGTRVGQSIRVHLTSVPTSTLDGTARIRVLGLGTTTGAARLSVEGGRVRATLPNGSSQLTERAVVEWEGTRHWAGTASTLRVPQADGSGPLDLRHGRVEVTVRDGLLNIVTVLRLTDEYLYGLAEMPSSWPAAALQAQAAAGRTYALRSSSAVKAECDCHVWDEVRSQKFTGWAKENEVSGGVRWGDRWKAAVDATVRRTTTGSPSSALSTWYGGAPIEALYHSSNGGYTRSNQTVFAGSALPYLQARPDPYSVSAEAQNPYRSWTATVTHAQAARAFQLAEIERITVARDAHGVPQTATARSSEGRTATISVTRMRNALGLRSGWVTGVSAG